MPISPQVHEQRRLSLVGKAVGLGVAGMEPLGHDLGATAPSICSGTGTLSLLGLANVAHGDLAGDLDVGLGDVLLV